MEATVLLLLLIPILGPNSAVCSPTCHLGTYLSTPEGPCIPCLDETFMPQTDHTNTQCFQCTKIIDSKTEILITPCSATTDTVIHCVAGYFRRLPKNPRETARCEPCSKCSPGRHEIEPCEGFHDVRCCDAENYVVAYDQGYPYCQERPWLCRKGEYFHQTSFKCVACPDGSYMNQDYHTNTECWKCQGLSEHDIPKNSIIVQHCNKTHPAVIQCEKGFYINTNMGYSKSGTGCKPCTTCDDRGMHVGRECKQTHDTMCCPHQNMVVADTPSGPECQNGHLVDSVFSSEVPVCKENHYIHIDNRNLSTARCEHCQDGTYMDEGKHRHTECKLCSELEGQWIPKVCLGQYLAGATQVVKNDYGNVYTIMILNCLISAGTILLFVIYLLFYLKRKRKNKKENVDDEKEVRAPLNRNRDNAKDCS